VSIQPKPYLLKSKTPFKSKTPATSNLHEETNSTVSKLEVAIGKYWMMTTMSKIASKPVNIPVRLFVGYLTLLPPDHLLSLIRDLPLDTVQVNFIQYLAYSLATKLTLIDDQEHHTRTFYRPSWSNQERSAAIACKVRQELAVKHAVG
jgi:hypothetical protein